MGGATNPGNTDPAPQSPPRPASQPLSDTLAEAVRYSEGVAGIGPAFRYERPTQNDLDTATQLGNIEYRSGRWRDMQGRDGSSTGEEILKFIQSFLRQTVHQAGSGDDLYITDFGEQKTLRISNKIRENERKEILKSLQNINMALPYEQRILLGEDLSEFTEQDEVPEGEIHIHITSGKEGWPDEVEPEQVNDIILGIGGSQSRNLTVIGGYVLMDRNAVEQVRSPARWEFVITHELLHAYGINAHVDSTDYPDSVLVPRLDQEITEVPRLFVTLDGELLLALQSLSPGTPISGLTLDDFDQWEEDGFHLLGTMKMAGIDDSIVEFGAGFRNGFAKPWVTGPIATTPLSRNPEFAEKETATWRGSLLGFTRQGRTTTGDTMIRINFQNWKGLAEFTQIETWQKMTHPGTRGDGVIWNDGDLSYAIQTYTGQGIDGFISTATDSGDPGSVTGIFTGNRHEGVAGILEHPDLSAAFGGVRGEPE